MYILNVKMVVHDETELPKDYFEIQKWSLKLIGLSVSPDNSILYRIYTVVIMTLSLIYVPLMIPNTWRNQQDFLDYEEFINTWMFVTGYIVITTKLVAIFFNRPKLHEIFQILQKGVFIPSVKRGGKKEQIWKSSVISLTRKLAIMSLIVGLCTTVACVSGAIFIHNVRGFKKLPFGSLLMLTENFNYYLVFLYQGVIYGIAIEVFMVADVVYAALLAHITVQCRILQNFIVAITDISRRTMVEETSETIPNSSDEFNAVPYSYLQRTLKEAILHHIAVLHAAEKVEDIFNIPTLGVYVGMSVCFCFIMYHGSLYPFVDPRFLKDFLILFTATLPLAINSYWGSEVIFQSQAVADACYKIDFVGTDVKFQKALVLMIERSQKPIKQTVGKFAILSLVTMLGLMRVSYSYFMILRRVNDKGVSQ